MENSSFVPQSVQISKRVVDLTVSTIALLVLLPLWPVLAALIKLDSPGPIIYRQLRIGQAHADRTELFYMLKFRTMVQDAEKRSGPVWASQSDSRVTRSGKWLRKTRLDELPQLINVICGEMSLIGPRPERPGFYQKLDRQIPYFAERTWGLRPGITGLAQVRQGYDQNIDDVRRKVGFDHAYAMSLCGVLAWLRMDIAIAFETLSVMVSGRGL